MKSEEHLQIWRQIKNYEKLFEIYGYFPTLHDAKILNIEINNNQRKLSMTVNYCDLIGESDDEVSTRFEIIWKQLQNADLKWAGEGLQGMQFSFKNEFIKTDFEDYNVGLDGEIISKSIEIGEIQINPEKINPDEVNTIKFSIR